MDGSFPPLSIMPTRPRPRRSKARRIMRCGPYLEASTHVLTALSLGKAERGDDGCLAVVVQAGVHADQCQVLVRKIHRETEVYTNELSINKSRACSTGTFGELTGPNHLWKRDSAPRTAHAMGLSKSSSPWTFVVERCGARRTALHGMMTAAGPRALAQFDDLPHCPVRQGPPAGVARHSARLVLLLLG